MVAIAGTHTLADINTFVKRAFGDDAGVQITDADIAGWVNSGFNKIASDLPIFESIATTNTVIGTNSYSLPADLMLIKEVLVNGLPLTRSSPSDIQTSLANDQVGLTGVPFWWYNYANQIYVYPSPGAIVPLQIFYNSYPTKVSNLGDLLGIPDRYYDLLCDYVMARVYELDENPSMMTAKLNYFDAEVKKLGGEDQRQNGQFPVVGEYQYGEGDYFYGSNYYAG